MVLAVATHAQAAALTAAAVGAAAVLVLRDARVRAIAMLGSLVLAGGAVVALKAHAVSDGILSGPVSLCHRFANHNGNWRIWPISLIDVSAA